MNLAECRTHAAAMVDLIDGGPAGGPDTELMDALRACEHCRPDVEAILLGSWALERAWQVARDVEPPETAWPKVRDLARRPRGDAWRGRAHVLGIGMAAVLIALLSSGQLAATIGSGRGHPLVESRSVQRVDRGYDPAVTRTALTSTGTVAAGTGPAPAEPRSPVRPLAVDRSPGRQIAVRVAPIRAAPAESPVKGDPRAL